MRCIKTLPMKTKMKQGEQNLLQELLGPTPNRRIKTENGRQVNKGKIHRITISLGPCEKLGSTKWRSQELKVDNIMFG